MLSRQYFVGIRRLPGGRREARLGTVELLAEVRTQMGRFGVPGPSVKKNSKSVVQGVGGVEEMRVNFYQ